MPKNFGFRKVIHQGYTFECVVLLQESQNGIHRKAELLIEECELREGSYVEDGGVKRDVV
jgi:hypothetical protein